MRNPLTSEAEDFVGLGAGRNLELHPSIQGGNFYLGAQGGLGETDGNLADNVVSIPLKYGMRFYSKTDVEISGRASSEARFPLSGQAESRSVIDPSGNLHLYPTGSLDSSRAPTVSTWIFYNGAPSPALSAGAGHREESLTDRYVAVSLTGGTGLGLRSWLDAATRTG